MTRRAAFVPAAFALVCASILPRLADRGMFLDGVTYAAIARNLAAGDGAFWHPHYTDSVYPDFHEQPPLGIAVQALAFRLAGDHLLVERLYSFGLAMLSAVLIAWIWRLAHGADRAPRAWMPIVLWISAPVVSWSFVNNMLENVQGVFTLLATAAVLKAMAARSRLGPPAWGALSGLAVTAAVLSKGPVGFFPVAAPWVFGTAAGLARAGPRETGVTSRGRRPLTVSLAQLLVIGGMLVACWSHGPARESLGAYVDQQLRPTLAGERETSASRLRFAKTLGQELLPMALLTAALLGWSRARHREGSDRDARDRALGFLLLAAAASLPLVLSPKQSGHYIVPSIPMFALACASVARGAGERLLPESGRLARAAPWVAGVLTAASLAALVSGWGSTVRDAPMLRDLERILARVPPGSTIGLCPAGAAEWGLHAYAQRIRRVSLDAGARPYRWTLVLPSAGCAEPDGCRAVALGTARLHLYECAAQRDGENRGIASP